MRSMPTKRLRQSFATALAHAHTHTVAQATAYRRRKHLPEDLDGRVLITVSTTVHRVGTEVDEIHRADSAGYQHLELIRAEHAQPVGSYQVGEAPHQRGALVCDATC